jgi:hypothetical protein
MKNRLRNSKKDNKSCHIIIVMIWVLKIANETIQSNTVQLIGFKE